MLGHRLRNLLEDLLPKHPQCEEIHKRIAAEQLRIVNHYNEQVALLIDQQEYSKLPGKITIYSGDSDDSGIVDNDRHLSETIRQTPAFNTIASPAASFDDESEISPIQPMQDDDGFISLQDSPPGSVNASDVEESIVFAYTANKPSSKHYADRKSSQEKTASTLKYRARKPSRKHVVSPDDEMRSNKLPSFLSQAEKELLESDATKGSSANVNQAFTQNGAEIQSKKSVEATLSKTILTTNPPPNSSDPPISHERSSRHFEDCDPHPSADNIEVISSSGKQVMFETGNRLIEAISCPGKEDISLQTHMHADQHNLLNASEMSGIQRRSLTEQASESAFTDSKWSYQQPSNSTFSNETGPMLKRLGTNMHSREQKQSSSVDSSRVTGNIRAANPLFSSHDARLAEPRTFIEDVNECGQEVHSFRMEPLAYCESRPDAARPRPIYAKATSNETANHSRLDRNGRLRQKEMLLKEERESTLSSAPVVTGDFPPTNVSIPGHGCESLERSEELQKDSGEISSGVAVKDHRNHHSTTRIRSESQDVSTGDFIWDSPNKSKQWSHESELAATFPVFEFYHSEKQCQATELDEVIRNIAEDTAPAATRREIGKLLKAKIHCTDKVVNKSFPSSPSLTHDGWSLSPNVIHRTLVEPRNIFSEYDESSSRTESRGPIYDRMMCQPTTCSSFSSNPANSSATYFNVDWGDLSLDQDTQGYLDSLDLLAIAPPNKVNIKTLRSEDEDARERSRALSSRRQCTPYTREQSNASYLSSHVPRNDFQNGTLKKITATVGSREHAFSAKPKYIPSSVSVFTSSVNTNHSLMGYEEDLIEDNTARNAAATFKTVFSFCMMRR